MDTSRRSFLRSLALAPMAPAAVAASAKHLTEPRPAHVGFTAVYSGLSSSWSGWAEEGVRYGLSSPYRTNVL